MPRAADHDPDAIWRPGYTGGFRTPERSPAEPPPRRRNPFVGAAVAVAVLLVVSVAIATGVLRSSDGGDAPDAVAELDRWSVTFDTARVGAVTTDEEQVLLVVDRPGALVALARGDGSERWRRSAPGASVTGLDVVDGVVLARHVEADGRGSVAAFDASDGIPLWDDTLAVGERIEVYGTAVVRSDPDTAGHIDPRTGELVDPARVGTAPGPSDHVVRGLGPDRPIEVAVPGATIRLLVDAATASATLTYQRVGARAGTAAPDDP